MQQKREAMRISRAAAPPAERIDGPLRLRTVKGRPDAPKNKRATVIWAPVCRLRTQTRQIFASASRCSKHMQYSEAYNLLIIRLDVFLYNAVY
ncbi:Uncharacterized protein DBV15_06997 [Temnothorax longispinosus]|uniref:Uncharacterized protein n=1 Tax=Temnothorax longispinosus TaxID=300112 RepID=A0A4S2JGX7_9HYME|nr:Uncharacterized protein DBV15_06997 [Temnothorax longispinosus]